jgi:ParB family chromosome partitioning protein
VGKTDELIGDIGDQIAESVGVREGAPADVPAGPGAPGPYTGFGRLQGAGSLPTDALAPDPGQPRKEFDRAELDLLAESIRKRGLLQPIRVRWDRAAGGHVIEIGERRWRAAKLAGLDRVSVILVEAAPSEAEILADQLLENLSRIGLSTIEQSHAFRRYMDLTGATGKELAGLLHVAPSTVSRALSLLDLDPEQQAQVAAGAISPTAGAELARIKNPEVRRKVADRVTREALPADSVAKTVRQKRGPAAAAKRQPDNQVIRLRRGLRVTVHSTRKLSAEDVVAVLEEALERARETLRGTT